MKKSLSMMVIGMAVLAMVSSAFGSSVPQLRTYSVPNTGVLEITNEADCLLVGMFVKYTNAVVYDTTGSNAIAGGWTGTVSIIRDGDTNYLNRAQVTWKLLSFTNVCDPTNFGNYVTVTPNTNFSMIKAGSGLRITVNPTNVFGSVVGTYITFPDKPALTRTYLVPNGGVVSITNEFTALLQGFFVVYTNSTYGYTGVVNLVRSGDASRTGRAATTIKLFGFTNSAGQSTVVPSLASPIWMEGDVLQAIVCDTNVFSPVVGTPLTSP